MRHVLFFLLPVALFCSDDAHLQKEFRRMDTAYTKKSSAMKHEIFKNYSVGSKNWCQNPLGVFKLYIEGTYLDSLFLKQSQNEPKTLLFDSSICQSLKSSIKELDPTFNCQVKADIKDKISTTTSEPRATASRHTFKITSLKEEITKAIGNLNFAIESRSAQPVNTQVIEAKSIPFHNLQIGANYWQSDILGSFSALESLKNLQQVFANSNNGFSQNVDLLSLPLKQGLINNYFENTIQRSNIELQTMAHINTKIKDRAKLNKELIFNPQSTYQELLGLESKSLKCRSMHYAIAKADPLLADNTFCSTKQKIYVKPPKSELSLSLDQENYADQVISHSYFAPSCSHPPAPNHHAKLINQAAPTNNVFLKNLEPIVFNRLEQQQLYQNKQAGLRERNPHLVKSTEADDSLLEIFQPQFNCRLQDVNQDLVTLYVKPSTLSYFEKGKITYQDNNIHILYPRVSEIGFERYNPNHLEINCIQHNAFIQEHNIFAYQQDLGLYALALDHPSAIESSYHLASYNTMIPKRQYAFTGLYFHANFKHYNDLDILPDSPIIHTQKIALSCCYSPSSDFSPIFLSQDLTYDIQAHLGDTRPLTTGDLYLSNDIHSNIPLHYTKMYYQLHDYALLDKIFNQVFVNQDDNIDLPASNYQPNIKTKNSEPKHLSSTDGTNIQYIDAKNTLLGQKLETYKFNYTIQDECNPSVTDLHTEASRSYALASQENLEMLKAIKLSYNEDELLKQLTSDPINQVQSLSNSFSSDVQVIPNIKDKNYLFRIKMDCGLKKSPLKHTIYFVLDHTRDMKSSEFQAYKEVINRSLSKLKKNKTFFNIVTIGQDVYKLHAKNLKPTKGSIHLAGQFLEKLRISRKGDARKIFEVIQKIKYDSAKKNEMSSIILMSSLKPFKEFSQFKLPLQKISQIKAPHFQLFALHYGSKIAASGLNLLARLNRGHLINSTSSKKLYKKATMLIAKTKRPFLTDIKLTLADPTQKNVEFTYCSDYNPIIHSQKSFYIYGKLNTLENIKFVLQGKQDTQWVNIVQQIDFKEANIAKGSLERRLATERSLYWYARYFNEPHPRFLKIAKDEQRPFEIALP